MPQFKMYQQLSGGREVLVSLFDSDRDEITAVHGAKPVRIQAAPARKATPVAQKAAPVPPKPALQPRKLTLAQAAVKYHLCPTCLHHEQDCHCAPQLGSMLDRIVALQRKQGLRP